MKNSVNKLLSAFNENIELNKAHWADDKIYHSLGCQFNKKWLANIVPSELLSRSLKEIIDMIMTLSEGDNFYTLFPDEIYTPNYGDNWGRFANYIELNNRAIAQMNNDKCCCGLVNSIKLLPAIPPSGKSWANCVVISQIFPNIFGDGYNKGPYEENSIYGLKLNSGYSENIISFDIKDKISPEEQLKAFCDLCHFRGIKAGFRMIISEDQMKIVKEGQEEIFRWNNDEHVQIYINECAKLMKLGFEAMFIDSAKHIGGYDMQNYTGVGALPQYHQMQYILNEIRLRSQRNDLSFAGEKSSDDFERYKNMGLTTGTDYITGDDFEKVKELSTKLKYYRDYAPGVEIENDNYEGGISYEQRLHRISTALFANEIASDKLPSFMQTNDIFPLRYDTNTHHIMMTNPSYSTDGSPQSHYENLFAKDDGRNYNHRLGIIFAHALCR